MRGLVVPFRKAPEPPPRGRSWLVAIALTGAIVLGIALLASCGHSQVGTCAELCTPDPVMDRAIKACVDISTIGRVCSYRDLEGCTDFVIRKECHGQWEHDSTECELDLGRPHG